MRIEKMAFTSTPEKELEYVITAGQGMQIANPPGSSAQSTRVVKQLSV
jgi:KaiC/GvpD/RAD55 family RecA-like ATPase